MGRITDYLERMPGEVRQRAAGVLSSRFFRYGLPVAVLSAVALPVVSPLLALGAAAVAAYVARPLFPFRFRMPVFGSGVSSSSTSVKDGVSPSRGDGNGRSRSTSRVAVGNSGSGEAGSYAKDPLLRTLIGKLEGMGLQVNTDWDAAMAILSSLSEKYNHLRSHKKVYGFVYQGVIHINPQAQTIQTPIHEYAHIWAEVLRQRNSDEWRKIVGMMKELRTGDGKKLWNVIKKSYPHLETDDEIADEVLATYSGRRGASLLKESYSGGDAESAIRDTLAGALERFWKAVCSLFDFEYTSADDVAEKVLADFLMDVNPMEYAVVGEERMSDRFPQHDLGSVSIAHDENNPNIKDNDMKDSNITEVTLLTGAIAESTLQEILASEVSDCNSVHYPAYEGTAGFFVDIAADGSETVTAFDNSSGACWVENFHTLQGAEKWGRGELSADEVHDLESGIDEFILSKDMSMENTAKKISFDESDEAFVKLDFHDGYALDVNKDSLPCSERLGVYYPTVGEVAASVEMQESIEGYTGRSWSEGSEHEKIFDIALRYGRYSSVVCPQERLDAAVDAVIERTKDVRARAFTPEQASVINLAADCAGCGKDVQRRDAFFSSLADDANERMPGVNTRWIEDTKADLQKLARYEESAVENIIVGRFRR